MATKGPGDERGWQGKRLTQEEAAQILGVSDRTFRRYVDRYEDPGLKGLVGKRLSQDSHRRAPVDEVMARQDMYQQNHSDLNAKHFHSLYKRQGGKRGYLGEEPVAGSEAVSKTLEKGVRRKHRERAALPGMMIHQDASSHEWLPGQKCRTSAMSKTFAAGLCHLRTI
jgi:hypothetical protein